MKSLEMPRKTYHLNKKSHDVLDVDIEKYVYIMGHIMYFMLCFYDKFGQMILILLEIQNCLDILGSCREREKTSKE